LISAVAKSSSEVDVTWIASSDNVGVAGYELTRSGSFVTLLPAGTLSYADTTATPGSSYIYYAKAFDAAGNVSTASNSIQVSTPTSPALPPCAAPGSNSFTGCYYNGITLTGSPALVRTDNSINFDWNSGSPSNAISPTNFSVRWEGTFTFNSASYSFTVVASDGVRVYMDGVNILDAWKDQPATTYHVNQTLSSGSHLVTVELYEHTGGSTVQVSWQ
jgi:hypothetical protein